MATRCGWMTMLQGQWANTTDKHARIPRKMRESAVFPWISGVRLGAAFRLNMITLYNQ